MRKPGYAPDFNNNHPSSCAAVCHFTVALYQLMGIGFQALRTLKAIICIFSCLVISFPIPKYHKDEKTIKTMRVIPNKNTDKRDSLPPRDCTDDWLR